MTHSSHNSTFRGLGGKIFLIGFMGSGKTYWGKKWAQQYHVDFYDLDELIEMDQKKTIAKIFEKEGEQRFRQIETAALKTLSAKDNCIVACGGGAACFNDNIQWMNENGFTVYLQAKPQFIYDKIFEEKNKRPLISKLNQGELFFFIEQKLKERELFYNQAKLILPVEELNENSLSTLNPKL